MVDLKEGEVMRYEFHDPIHQTEHVPRQVHAVHERPRNAARVRLRLRALVPLRDLGPLCDSGQTASACASQYLRYLGVRVRHFEEVKFYTRGNFYCKRLSITAIIENAADRIEDHNGSASQ